MRLRAGAPVRLRGHAAVRPCGNRVKLGICAKTGSPPGSTDGAKCKSVHIFRNAMHLPSSRFFILKICTLLVETPECAAPIGRTELPGRECSDEKESRQTRDSCQSRSPRGSDTEFDAISHRRRGGSGRLRTDARGDPGRPLRPSSLCGRADSAIICLTCGDNSISQHVCPPNTFAR